MHEIQRFQAPESISGPDWAAEPDAGSRAGLPSLNLSSNRCEHAIGMATAVGA